MRASRFAAGYGARVAVAESGRFGGTCVNVGCIPKKLFAYAAHYREDFEVAKSFGWAIGEPRFDWATLIANKDREIARLNVVYERVLVNAGVTIHRERATVLGPHEVEVGGKKISAKHMLVATGSWPTLPAIPLLTACGYVLAESQASLRLLRFFKALLGWMPGGLAVIVIAVCALFTTFTGASSCAEPGAAKANSADVASAAPRSVARTRVRLVIFGFPPVWVHDPVAVPDPRPEPPQKAIVDSPPVGASCARG